MKITEEQLQQMIKEAIEEAVDGKVSSKDVNNLVDAIELVKKIQEALDPKTFKEISRLLSPFYQTKLGQAIGSQLAHVKNIIDDDVYHYLSLLDTNIGILYEKATKDLEDQNEDYKNTITKNNQRGY